MNRFMSKDFWSGVMFVGFGLFALTYGSNLAVGTAVRMGPGYVPRMLSYILIGLGLVILVRAIITPGDTIERLYLRPIVMITIGVLAFALLFETAGMFPALVALIFLSALGGQEFMFVETVLACLVLRALCTLLFKIGLDMNIMIVRGVW